MWLDRFTTACRDCPDLLAIYESPRGRLALLLRQTLTPRIQDYLGWRAETRHDALVVIDRLRRSGFVGGAVVLQSVPLSEAANIMRTWTCRYDADPARRAELGTAAERLAAEERFVSTRTAFRQATSRGGEADGPRPPFAASVKDLRALRRWYDAMALEWLGIQPDLRRALVLRCHRWVADRVLVPAADGELCAVDAVVELDQDLTALIPPAELVIWRPWIELVTRALTRALRRPPGEWNRSWVRMLFLIPLNIPPRAPTAVRVSALASD